MPVICNPLNINYRYQFNKDPRTGSQSVNREAADPSMIFYQGRYYVFASMTLGVWVSDDLAHWENHRLPDDLPRSRDERPLVLRSHNRRVACGAHGAYQPALRPDGARRVYLDDGACAAHG